MPEAAKSEKKTEASAEAAPEAKAAPKAKGPSKLVPALLGLNSLILAAVLAVVILRPDGLLHRAPARDKAAEPVAEEQGKEAPAKEGAAAKEGGGKTKEKLPGPMMRLPNFVVHLKDTDADRYARISFEIEVEDDKAKEALNARLPVIRDSFLTYLSDRSAAELRGGEAIAKVKTALTDRLAGLASGVPLHGLYVTELVVQ